MADDSPGDSSFLPTHQQAVTQPLVFGLDILNQEVAQRDISSPGKEVLENAMDDCLQQLSDLQLNKVHILLQPLILCNSLVMCDVNSRGG